jgi:lysyl-tRNA synthetase class 2
MFTRVFVQLGRALPHRLLRSVSLLKPARSISGRVVTLQQKAKEPATSSDDYYSQHRLDLLASVRQFPQDFRPSVSVLAFREKYNDLQPGMSAPKSTVEFLCGRIASRRDSGHKLFFMDLASGGEKVQIMASEGSYLGDDFGTMFSLLRRGDIIGS